MDWDAHDFAVAGILLAGTALAFGLAFKVSSHRAYRAAAALALIGALALTWINLAVGIIGSEDNTDNLMYGAVLAVGLVGSLIARFRPRGMSHTLIAMALVQGLVPAIAQAPGLHIWILTGFFMALWLGSAWLFTKAVAV